MKILLLSLLTSLSLFASPADYSIKRDLTPPTDKVKFVYFAQNKEDAMVGAFAQANEVWKYRKDGKMEVIVWQDQETKINYFVAILQSEIPMGILRDRKKIDGEK